MVHHRIRFRDGTNEQTIRTANLLGLVGAACLGLAIGCAVYVVGDVAFPTTPMRWADPAVVVLAGLVWLALPLTYRSDQTDRSGQPDQ